MATIAFDASFAKAERVILSKTFKQNCVDLDIWKKDFTVHVRRDYFSNPGQYARVAHPSPMFFIVEMNSNEFNLFDATSALGHEAVHMKQHLTGQLEDHWSGGSIWNGKHYPEAYCENKANYHDLPWEKEAWDKQLKLHKAAVAVLDKNERQLCHPKYSNGLVELWLDEEIALERQRKAA